MRNDHIPGMRRWRKNRKQLFLILAAMSLCFFLIEMTFLFSDSLELTMQERRMDAYGEWQYALKHISEEDEAKILALPLLEKAGTVWTAGDIENEAIKGAFAIGGMDENAIDLSRLTLVDGHFPEKAGEAAVEATILKKLGVEMRVGETIVLEIAPYQKSNDTSGTKRTSGKNKEIREITLTVCGIIKDYSTGWCISTNIELPGVFITEETATAHALELPSSEDPQLARAHNTLLMKGRPEWTSIREDMDSFAMNPDKEMFRAGRDGKYTNYYAYPDADKADSLLGPMMISLRLISIFLGTLILLITVWYSAKSRFTEWQDLYTLGAPIRLLRRNLIQEALIFALISIGIGLGLALLLFTGGQALLPGLQQTQLYFQLSWFHLLLTALIGSASVAIAYFLPVLRLRRIADGSRKEKQMRRKCRYRRMKRSVPSMWSIWFREQRERPLWFFAELVLLIGILAMPCIGVHMVGAKAQEIRVIESRSSDYIFDNDKHGNTGVDEERLNRLKDIYGVSEVRAWHRLQMSSNEISESMLIDLSAYLDDEAVALSFALREEFLQARSEEIQQQIEWADPDSDSGKRERKALEKDLQANENALQALQDGYYPLDFYSTSDETELRKILRNLEAGAITEEEFLSGEKAVLLLAPWQQPSDLYGDTYYTVNVKQYQNPEDGVYVKCLSPEEPVSVQYGGEETQIPVGGILYGLDQADDLRVLMASPFAVLCSDAMFERIVSGKNGSSYQYVEIDASMDADYITDKQVEKALAGMESDIFTNRREELAQMKQDYYASIGFYGVLCGLGSVLCLMIFYSMAAFRSSDQAKEQELFAHLGMKQSWKNGKGIAETLLPGLLSIGIVTLGLSVFYTWQTRLRVSTIEFSIDVGMNAGWYLFICLLYLAVILMVQRQANRIKQERAKKI